MSEDLSRFPNSFYYSMPTIERVIQNFASKEFLKNVSHSKTDKKIDVGSGVNYYHALSYLMDHSSVAGSLIPPVSLNYEDGSLFHFWTEEEMREFMHSMAVNTNLAESVVSSVKKQITELVSFFLDSNNSDENRIEAYWDVVAYEHYALNGNRFRDDDHKTRVNKTLHKAINEVVSLQDATPTDLPTAIKVLLSRLEAAANTNLKRILNAVTQQGMDLPASCFDQETAVTEIGAIKQKYQLQIETATTIDEAKGYFDDAVKDLDNVTPLNTPEWSQYDANTHLEIGFNKDLEYEFVSDTPVVIAARHPQTPEGNNLIDGLVSVTITEGNRRYAESNVIITPDRTHIRTEMRLIPPDKGLRPRMWRFTARNLCGPSKSICVSIRRETEGNE